MDQFRLSIVFDVAYSAGAVVLLTALCVVLRPVSRHLAALAALLKFVYVGSAMMMVLNWQAVPNLIANPRYSEMLGADHSMMLVQVNRSAAMDDYYVGLAFWALSATVIGWLWSESGYVPRPSALFGFAAAAWCAVCAFAYLGDPGFAQRVNLWWFDTPLAIFDIALSLWLRPWQLWPIAE